jgi:hypothetical protein
MKKNFYKIFTLIALLFIAAVSRASIAVTYTVDISDSASSPTFTIDPTGIKIAGNFDELNATLLNGDTISNWAPTAPAANMTNVGGNIWSITVLYPDTAVGDIQQWKFVNGNWGGDEGQNNTTDLDSTCGIGNGLGGFNRMLAIPNANAVYASTFNQCGTLTLTGINEIQNGVNSLNVYPNPAINFTQVSYSLTANDHVVLTLRSFTGQVLETLISEAQSRGTYSFDLNTGDLSNGMYFVQITTGGMNADKRFVVNR